MNFNNYPLDHSLDKKQIKHFIDMSDLKVRNICKKIFKYTIHISFENFLYRLNICINEILDNINLNKPIFIFIPKTLFNDYKNKSNYWLYNYIQNYIKFKISLNEDILIINDIKNNSNDDNIIFIDDCIYSGTQLGAGTILNLNNKKKLKLNLFILVPFISDEGIDYIIQSFNYNETLSKYCDFYICKKAIKILPVFKYLSENEINLIQDFYSEHLFNFKFNYLIYFDHKIADTISTITYFYYGIVPNNKNKKLLNIYNSDSKIFNNSKKFDIIPIIKNCNINNLLSLDCPHPPYKITFNEFIKNIKKSKNKYNSLQSFKFSKSLKSYKKNKSF